jgi:hypothetical protein
MSTFALWVCDLLRGQTSGFNSTNYGAASASNVADGDPTTYWSAGVASAMFVWGSATAYKVTGVGIGAHNLVGKGVEVQASTDGTNWTTISNSVTVRDNHDFVITVGLLMSASYWRIIVAGQATTSLISIGVISLLGDYGYNTTETVAEGQSRGILSLANEAGFGVRTPIGGGGFPSVAKLPTIGASVSRIVSSPVEAVSLSVNTLRTGLDLEWWKVRKSYMSMGTGIADVYANPGWVKNLWITPDDYSPTNLWAWYVEPTTPLQWEISESGGRVSAKLEFQTLPTGE